MPLEVLRRAMTAMVEDETKGKKDEEERGGGGGGGAEGRDGGGEPKRCAACFGIFLKDVDEFSATMRSKILERGYDLQSVRTVMLSLSVPSSVIIRHHCLSEHLNELLTSTAASGSGSGSGFAKPVQMIEMKEAFRWIYAEDVLHTLNAKLEQSSSDDATGTCRP